jgi:hypothetical protein
MDRRFQPSARELLGFGAVFVVIGLYFILVSAEIFPAPGGHEAVRVPLWLVFCAGLAFLLGGAAVVIRAAAPDHPGQDGALPPSAPRWLHVVQFVMVLGIFVCFGAIGSWIAFGPGPRLFSASGPIVGAINPGDIIGRTVFGIGAVIIWSCTIAIAIVGVRKLLRRTKA